MAKLKRILYFSDCYIFGGCENLLVNLLNNEQIRSNYDVHFAYRYSKVYQEGVNNKINGQIKKYPVRLLDNSSLFYLLGLKGKGLKLTLLQRLSVFNRVVFRKTGALNLINAVRLFRLFKRVKPDILHINDGGYPGSDSSRTAVVSAKLAGIKKIVFTVNNLASAQNSLIDRIFDAYVSNNVDCFITASKAARVRLAEDRRFDLARIFNIPNTLSSESVMKNTCGTLRREFGLGDDVPVIGSVGLLTRRKGYDILIEAINQLKGKDGLQELKCFIIGEGEERAALEALIRRHQLERTVFLLGYRSNIWGYLKDFDVFVLPSRNNEDFPYVILEAMLLGKPVVGTRVAGIPEQIDHDQNGFVVDPGDVNAVACAIEYLSLNLDKRSAMGKSSVEKYAELFNYNLVMGRYYELYQKL